jgi:hypothetical protein
MTAEFEPFVQIAGLLKALTGLHDNLAQTTQKWMERLQQGMYERSREFAAALAEHEKEQAEAFRVLAQGGWVGMERHFTSSQARSVLEIQKARVAPECKAETGQRTESTWSVKSVFRDSLKQGRQVHL